MRQRDMFLMPKNLLPADVQNRILPFGTANTLTDHIFFDAYFLAIKNKDAELPQFRNIFITSLVSLLETISPAQYNSGGVIARRKAYSAWLEEYLLENPATCDVAAKCWYRFFCGDQKAGIVHLFSGSAWALRQYLSFVMFRLDTEVRFCSAQTQQIQSSNSRTIVKNLSAFSNYPFQFPADFKQSFLKANSEIVQRITEKRRISEIGLSAFIVGLFFTLLGGFFSVLSSNNATQRTSLSIMSVSAFISIIGLSIMLFKHFYRSHMFDSRYREAIKEAQVFTAFAKASVEFLVADEFLTRNTTSITVAPPEKVQRSSDLFCNRKHSTQSTNDDPRPESTPLLAGQSN